jgi:hypothetical protein
MNSDEKFRFSDVLRTRWNPTPVDAPKVDPDITNLDGLSRSAESIRYSILSLEFWISKDGQCREWLRHNGRWAFVLAIPAFAILPIVTFALWQMVGWTLALVSIAGHLIIFPILALLAAFVIYVVVQILKAIFGK